jgi:thioredoxin-like negative regulator of GroEL
VKAYPALPKLVLLHGETGRGKTYAVQQFFDRLAGQNPGYWDGTLTPAWPPTSRREVNRERKRIQPAVQEQTGATAPPPFHWIAVGSAPAEGAIQVNMSISLAQQIHDQFSASLRAVRVRRGAATLGFKMALDALGAVLAPIAIGKTAVEHAAGLASLARGTGDLLVAQQHAIHEAFRSCHGARSDLPPTIVVLDDAQSLEYETLLLVSGLIGMADETDVGREYLPSSLGAALPGPLLIIATVWEHRLVSSVDDPLQRWLKEVETLELDTEWIPCREFGLARARDLMTTWREGDDDGVQQLLAHLNRSTGGIPAVNPLVLASAVGTLEEHRDPFSDSLVLSADLIDTLPVLPEQHLQDRLERVREESHGPQAIGLLELLARVAPQVPHQLFLELEDVLGAEPLQHAEALLVAHQIVSPRPIGNRPGAPPFSRALDLDLFHLVAGRLKDDRVPPPLLAALCGVLDHTAEWALSAESSGFFRNLRQQVSGLAAIARLVLNAAADPSLAVDPSAAVVAACVLGRSVPQLPEECSEAARGLAFAVGSLALLDAPAVVRICASSTPSFIASGAARRALVDGQVVLDADEESTMLEVLQRHREVPSVADLLIDVLVRRNDLDAAIEVLATFDVDSVARAMRAADVLALGHRYREALDHLRPWIGVSAPAAVMASNLLASRGEISEAIDVLRPVVGVIDGVQSRYADLLEQEGRLDEAIEALLPLATLYVDVPIRLAEIFVQQERLEDALELLTPLLDRNADVPLHWAGLMVQAGRADEAVPVLRALMDKSPRTASVGLIHVLVAVGDLDAALAVAAPPGAEIDLNAFTMLAKTLSDQGRGADAVRLLETTAEDFQNAATTLADVFIAQGDYERAIGALRTVSSKFKNAAIKLSQLLEVEDPVTAMEVLRPWLSDPAVVTRLAGLQLRAGDPETALQTLELVPARRQPPKTIIRLTALRAAAYAQAGRWQLATEQLRGVTRSQQQEYFFILFAALADSAGVQSYSRFVRTYTDTPKVNRIASSLVLRLARAAGVGSSDEFAALVVEVWADDFSRRRARRDLLGNLKAWAYDAGRGAPEIDGLQAIGCLEVASALGCDDLALRTACLDRIVESAETTVRIYQFAVKMSPLSAIAAEVLDRAATPPGWRGPSDDEPT